MGREGRFEREASAVAALSHPNIVAIDDYGTLGAVTYAVMELLEGETLRDRLTKGALAWTEAVEVGGAIAGGLGARHAKGILPRGVQAEKLFFTAHGRVENLQFLLGRIRADFPSPEENDPHGVGQN